MKTVKTVNLKVSRSWLVNLNTVLHGAANLLAKDLSTEDLDYFDTGLDDGFLANVVIPKYIKQIKSKIEELDDEKS